MVSRRASPQIWSSQYDQSLIEDSNKMVGVRNKQSNTTMQKRH
jgi:hypothetical protein